MKCWQKKQSFNTRPRPRPRPRPRWLDLFGFGLSELEKGKIMRQITILLVSVMMLVVCVGCQNKGLSENTTQQQQMVNDLDAQVKKMDVQMKQMEKEVSDLKQTVGKLQEAVKKAQPSYIGGNVQEGQ